MMSVAFLNNDKVYIRAWNDRTKRGPGFCTNGGDSAGPARHVNARDTRSSNGRLIYVPRRWKECRIFTRRH